MRKIMDNYKSYLLRSVGVNRITYYNLNKPKIRLTEALTLLPIGLDMTIKKNIYYYYIIFDTGDNTFNFYESFKDLDSKYILPYQIKNCVDKPETTKIGLLTVQSASDYGQRLILASDLFNEAKIKYKIINVNKSLYRELTYSNMKSLSYGMNEIKMYTKDFEFSFNDGILESAYNTFYRVLYYRAFETTEDEKIYKLRRHEIYFSFFKDWEKRVYIKNSEEYRLALMLAGKDEEYKQVATKDEKELKIIDTDFEKSVDKGLLNKAINTFTLKGVEIYFDEYNNSNSGI